MKCNFERQIRKESQFTITIKSYFAFLVLFILKINIIGCQILEKGMPQQGLNNMNVPYKTQSLSDTSGKILNILI